MTPLEIGSDIAGSIGCPPPTAGCTDTDRRRPRYLASAASRSLMCPSPVLRWRTTCLSGPLSIELPFDVIIGPGAGEDVAWRPTSGVTSRAPRNFRVAAPPPLEVVQPSAEMRARSATAGFLSHAGAKVDEAMPALDLDSYVRDYLTLLLAGDVNGQPPEVRGSRRARCGNEATRRRRRWRRV